MKILKITVTILLLATLFSCGKNEKNEEAPIINDKQQQVEPKSTAASDSITPQEKIQHYRVLMTA